MNILKAVQEYIMGLETQIDKKWITAAVVIIFILVLICFALTSIYWLF